MSHVADSTHSSTLSSWATSDLTMDRLGRKRHTDLVRLSRIFQVTVLPNATHIEVNDLCCQAVIKACQEGGLENFRKLENVRSMLACLRDRHGRHPIEILNDNRDRWAAELLSHVLLSEATDLFAKDGDTEAFRKVLSHQFFEVYIHSHETGDHALSETCKKALGNELSSHRGTLKSHPYFSKVSADLVGKLWTAGEKYRDCVLKAAWALLYKTFEAHRAPLPPDCEMPPMSDNEPWPGITITVDTHGRSCLEWHTFTLPKANVLEICHKFKIESIVFFSEPNGYVEGSSCSNVLENLQMVKGLEIAYKTYHYVTMGCNLLSLSKQNKIEYYKMSVHGSFEGAASMLGSRYSLTEFELQIDPNNRPYNVFPYLSGIGLALANSKAVRHLRISSCYPFHATNLQPLLEFLSQRSSLQSLHIVTTSTEEPEMNKDCLTLLSKVLLANKELQQLSLSLQIGSYQAFFEALKSLTQLRSLDLSRSAVTNEAATLLAAALPFLVNLQELHLNDNPFDMEHALLVRGQLAFVQNTRARLLKKDRKRQFLNKIQDEPNLQPFYRTVKLRLEELFISFKALAGGFVTGADGNLAMFHKLIGNALRPSKSSSSNCGCGADCF